MITIPFVLVSLINDGIFIWNLILQMLIFFMEQSMFKLFKFFTLNAWRPADFKARYMPDAADNDAIGDAGNGAGGELNMRLGNKVIDGEDSENVD